MFLENNFRYSIKRGWIEVITGSMFSGKTEELIRRIKRAEIANQKVAIFKPVIDNRYSETNVVSHDSKSVVSIPLKDVREITDLTEDTEVVAIDEAQFFEGELIEVCSQLANKGKRVIVAALDMDFMGKPFGPIPQLLSIAEYVTKVHAICIKCGNLAHYSHRLGDTTKLVVLGEKDIYEPLCRECYNLAQVSRNIEPELFN
ncbi:MAG: thymidine kinase [Bacteroidales bacterium]